MSGSKHRPFRDLATRVAVERPEPAPRFADAVGPVRRLDGGPGRIAPPAPDRPPPERAPEFVVRYEGDRVRAWREGASPLPSGLEPSPSSTLDLHGLDEAAARRAVQRFIVTRARRDQVHLLVVVGKGRRSPGGYGVLRLAVVDWLTTRPCARHVAAFRSASQIRGGSGAIYVRLVRQP